MFSDWESHWDIKIEKSILKNMANQDGGTVDSHTGTAGLLAENHDWRFTAALRNEDY